MITQSLKGSSLGEFFQANRLPIAVIGVGLVCLLADNIGLADRLTHNKRVQAERRRIGGIAVGGASEPERAQILGPDGEPALRTGDSRGNGWVHQAAGAARGAISSVRGAGSTVLEGAGNLTGYAGDAGDMAKRASGQLLGRLVRDPWVIGVVGLVAGALLAAVLPPTRVEEEFIGEARDELRNRATEFGHKAAERVRELVDSTARASQH